MKRLAQYWHALNPLYRAFIGGFASALVVWFLWWAFTL